MRNATTHGLVQGCLVVLIGILCTCTAFAQPVMDRESAWALFDADEVEGASFDALPIIRATLHKVAQADMDACMSVLGPIMFETNEPLDVIWEEWNGDSLVAKYYATDECKAQFYPNLYFYDGTYGANRMEQERYNALLPDHRMIQSYAAGATEFEESPRIPLDTTEKRVAQVLSEMALSVEAQPYMLNGCAGDGGDPAMGDCYSLVYRYCFNGVACYPFINILPSSDSYTFAPSVRVIYGESGLLSVYARNILDVDSQTEAYALIRYDQAADVAKKRKSLLLGVDAPICREVSLQYVPVPYIGGDIERDVELVPAWVFLLAYDNGIVEGLLVNAITGTIIE